MAVQAQHPLLSPPDFRMFQNNSNNLLEHLQMLHHNNQENLSHGLVGLFPPPPPLVYSNNNINNEFSSNQNSDITCILPQSRKRVRVDDGYQSRLLESSTTSTSGRSIALDLASTFYQQNAEIDALIRFQNERLRVALEQAQKWHCRGLIANLEQQVIKKLKEKESELATANRKNAELEEKVRLMSAENQIWFNVARNNEEIVTSLKMSLEQVMIQNAVNCNVNAAAGIVEEEGYGDSDGAALLSAEDAGSCCEGVTERTTNGAVSGRRRCRVCHEKDVSVLVLPCRHLCLCKDCESEVHTCPICHVSKNACLQIFMS